MSIAEPPPHRSQTAGATSTGTNADESTPDGGILAGAVIEEITAVDAHDLRRRVLRDGTPSSEVTFAEDERAGTVHLGIRATGAPGVGLGTDGRARIVAIATFLPSPTPWRPGRTAVQLRGMAVEPALQGTGFGRHLLVAAIERFRAAGNEVLWANARDSALGFYRRLGLTVVGPGFVSHDTGLPHHVVVLDL